MGKKRVVGGARGAERSDSRRVFVSEVVDGVSAQRVQIVMDEVRSAPREGCEEVGAFVDVSPMHRQEIVFELWKDSLVLKVCGKVGVIVLGTHDVDGRSRQVHPVGTDHEVVIPRRLLPSQAPVRRHASDVEPEVRPVVGLSSADVFRAVNRGCAVEVVIPHGISAESGHILAERPVNDRRGSRRWRHVRPHPGESPGGSAAPEVFNGWVVVERYTVDELFARELRPVGVPDVGVVPREVVSLYIVGNLDKCSDMGCILPGQEKADRLWKLKVPVLRPGLRLVGDRIGELDEGGEREPSINVEAGGRGSALRSNLRDPRGRVTVQLEEPAQRGELGDGCVAGTARQPRLAGKTGNTSRLRDARQDEVPRQRGGNQILPAEGSSNLPSPIPMSLNLERSRKSLLHLPPPIIPNSTVRLPPAIGILRYTPSLLNVTAVTPVQVPQRSPTVRTEK